MKKNIADNNHQAYKERLLKYCISKLEDRIEAATTAIANAQAAANAEEKSSAGDKYETSRAMSHLEKDMHSRQLEANRQELASLLRVDYKPTYQFVAPGAFISCDMGSFFIAAGLGKMQFEEKEVFALSPQAPLAKSLYGKRKGDAFTFKQKELIILELL